MSSYISLPKAQYPCEVPLEELTEATQRARYNGDSDEGCRKYAICIYNGRYLCRYHLDIARRANAKEIKPVANNRRSKSRQALNQVKSHPQQVLDDLQFLSDQLFIVEHSQDDEGIKRVRERYGIKRIWE